jgi:NAD(P)-dependent dehydrogenase (short-subunit alcohol dehydrogenase family)
MTNLLGTYHAFDAAARHMKGPGRLIATSSAIDSATSGHAAVSASKAGILGLVRATALELAPRRIACNAVIPGTVDSEVNEKRLAALAAENGKTKDEVRAEAAAGLPLGRLVQPEEVADVILFLCSTSGEGITGQTIAIGAGAPATIL